MRRSNKNVMKITGKNTKKWNFRYFFSERISNVIYISINKQLIRFQHCNGHLSRFCQNFAQFYRLGGHTLGVLRSQTATRLSHIQISVTNPHTNISDSSYHHQLFSMYGKSDINHIMILNSASVNMNMVTVVSRFITAGTDYTSNERDSHLPTCVVFTVMVQGKQRPK